MTISYGAFPNDVFLLFFGFVPDPNPHDAVPLFADLLDLVTAAAGGAAAGAQPGAAPAERLPAGSSDDGAAPRVPHTEQTAAAAEPEAGAGRPVGAAEMAEPPEATPARQGGAEAPAALVATQSGSSVAGAAEAHSAESVAREGRQAQGRPPLQPTADRLAAMLLERLPPGDYSRYVQAATHSS